ncbi:hypothetical protein [Sphingomonas sp.]|jgi:hypothetical protein|uniref:hypothetical protein n=1 Tax=Sphingomonas sp. TaxID=28214 RepID=UPI002ED98107
MNKPLQLPPVADDDIGPLDANGEQIWSSEEETASVRMWADPEFQAGLQEAERQIDRGEWHPHEEVVARSKEMKRRWFVEKGITPPPGYFER